VGTPDPPGGLCVYCRERPIVAGFRPFCSERCRLLDLRRWVDGSYRLPGEPIPRPDPTPEDN
jgi:endogenous inhibitor of DNA gyrase (YacG/DUF329 family)